MSSLLSGMDYWGYLANFAINHARGDDWKNELPVIQELQRLAYGSSSLAIYLSSDGDWDDMSDKEKKEIEKMFPVDAIFKQIKDWKKYREGDKDFIDALMGYKNEQEKKKFKKVDKIYEGVFGEPYKKSSGDKSQDPKDQLEELQDKPKMRIRHCKKIPIFVIHNKLEQKWQLLQKYQDQYYKQTTIM